MTVALAMIVRDAEKQLPRLFASVADVADPERSTIIDTGSTDGTLDVLRDWGCEPLTSEWRNFQHNRTELMQKAKDKADHLMLLDADLEIEWREPLPALTADIGMGLIHQGPIDFRLPFVVDGRKDWEYKGYAHSYLHAPEPRTRQNVDAFVVWDRGRVTEEKIRRDVSLLKQELADEPGNSRAMFYLAQSYRDLGEWDNAIECYRRRSEMGGFEEERWFALYRAGLLLVGYRSFADGAPLLVEAYKQRPWRAEPLRALAASAGGVADKLPYPKDDVLFVKRAHYLEASDA